LIQKYKQMTQKKIIKTLLKINDTKIQKYDTQIDGEIYFKYKLVNKRILIFMHKNS